MNRYEVIVIGGGINGLSTAYHLLRRGVRSTALLERFELGHARGSSHGKSRITRSSYSSLKYVELMQIAHREEWPRLSHEAGRPLIRPNRGCFFGPGIGPYVESLRSADELCDLYRVLEVKEAVKVFPQFRFPDSTTVIEDLTCGVVAAEETLRFLAEKVVAGATLVENCLVTKVSPGTSVVRLHTSAGEFQCDRLVVTAGGWLGKLFPELAPRFQVAHQDVGYVEVAGAEEFPVWVYAPAHGESFYGLPSFGRPGAKVARHRTGQEGDDPDRPIPARIPQAAAHDLEEFCARQFAHPAKLIDYEACLYTNTVNEDFVLDLHPRDPRIAIGAACSGHGFKFAPLTGRLLSELVLHGKSDLPLFERYRQAFQWPSHHPW